MQKGFAPGRRRSPRPPRAHTASPLASPVLLILLLGWALLPARALAGPEEGEGAPQGTGLEPLLDEPLDPDGPPASSDLGDLGGEAADPEAGVSPDVIEEAAPIDDSWLEWPNPAWEDATPVARVGEDVIRAGDLVYALDHGQGIDRSAPPESLRRRLLELVVNQRLLVQEAYRRGLERTPPIAYYADRLSEQLCQDELRRRIYSGKLTITEEEILELYERFHYTLGVRHLSVDRRDLAEEIHARLVAGEDFGDLARRHSEHKDTAVKGGDMGVVPAGRMIIHFEDAVFDLEPGQITDVIKGKGEHYKIFKLESKVRDRTPPRPLEAMRPYLAQRVRARKSGTALYTWQLAMFEKYGVELDDESFDGFAYLLRDKIASWEAVNAVRRDSLKQDWIFANWSSDDVHRQLAEFEGGRLIVGEFLKSFRGMKFCPTCLWRDSDVQLRQFVLGLVFDKLVLLERGAIRQERLPEIERELERRMEERMARMVTSLVAANPTQVSDEEARAFWEGRQAEYMDPERARVRRIVVESEEQARDILQRLEGGADFAALAERFSKDETTSWRGGETDFFGPGSMQGMADVALGHEPGELIPPFQSQLGWEVVVVLEKTPAAPKPFSEVEDHVKGRIAAERTRANVDALIEELRAQTPITIEEAALDRVSLSS